MSKANATSQTQKVDQLNLLLDKAAKTATIGAKKAQANKRAKEESKKGKTQINNLINYLQANYNTAGVKQLLLYIARQMSRNVIDMDFGTNLITDIQTIIKTNPDPELILEYLKYIKWSYEAMTNESIKPSYDSIKNLDSLLNEITKGRK